MTVEPNVLLSSRRVPGRIAAVVKDQARYILEVVGIVRPQRGVVFDRTRGYRQIDLPPSRTLHRSIQRRNGGLVERERDFEDRKSTRLNSSHSRASRMPSSA